MLLALIPLMAGLGFLALAGAPLLDTRLFFFDLLIGFKVQNIHCLTFRYSKAVEIDFSCCPVFMSQDSLDASDVDILAVKD